ncbi:MAG TPA: alpha/beta hydrolase-fold protein, partial [Chloroflexota bacterium]|nr:alpha/beta hydrolase-fold protein [Chloroflexota bacterium]
VDGAEGALQMALRNPDRFVAAGAHSPSLRTGFDQLVPAAQAYYGDEEAWRKSSPYCLVVDTDAARLVNIWLDVGSDDPWLPNVRGLHERLQDRGIEHAFVVFEGEHGAEYWEANLDDYLRFYSAAFSARLART